MVVAFSTQTIRKVWDRDRAWKKEMIFIEKVETSRKICKCAITAHIVVAFNFCSFFGLSPFLTRSLPLWNEHNSSSFLLRFSHFIFNRLVVLGAFCLLLWLLRLFMFIQSHAITRHKRCKTSCILLPLLLQLNYVSLNQYNRIKSECVLCTHLHIVFLHVNCICMWFNVNVLNMHIFTQFFLFLILVFIFVPFEWKKSMATTTATTSRTNTRTACVFYCALVYEYFKISNGYEYLLHVVQMRVLCLSMLEKCIGGKTKESWKFDITNDQRWGLQMHTK